MTEKDLQEIIELESSVSSIIDTETIMRVGYLVDKIAELLGGEARGVIFLTLLTALLSFKEMCIEQKRKMESEAPTDLVN